MENNNFKPETNALHTKIDETNVKPAATPIYQNSAFSADSPYFYTRKNNPNCEEFENIISIFEESKYCISVTTGMTAISIATSLLRPNDHIVLNKDIYGCTYKYFQRLTEQLNLSFTALDLSDPEQIEKIPSDVTMVFFETPTNPFLKTVKISEVSKKAKSLNPDALIVVDNTWATPLFQKPLQHGADICVYSATKFFGGHSDVMGGIITTDGDELHQKMRDQRFYSGAILDPHSAWMICRSMKTFTLRMREHERVAKEMRAFLEELPQVEKVYYPDVDGKQLTGYACILFFDLREDLVEKYQTFARSLKLFDTGTGMACVTSMVAQPYTGSHASMSDEEKLEMGLGKKHARLCFGLEDPEDLKKDIIQALKGIDS